MIYQNTDDWQKTSKEKLYVSRELFPYFQGATDDEIEEVIKVVPSERSPDKDVGAILIWTALGLQISVATLKEGDRCKTPFIRGRADKWQTTEQGWERKMG